MNYTNDQNIPEYLTKVLSVNSYNRALPSTVGVTDMLKPPRIFFMEKLYHKQKKADIGDSIHSRIGTWIHKGFEDYYANDPNVITEARMYAKVGDEILSGQFDVYFRDTGHLADVKTTSLYSPYKEDWEKQLNVYAWLFRNYSYLDDGVEELRDLPVNGVKIIRVFRDWSRSRSESSEELLRPIDEVMIPLWSHSQQDDFVMSKIEAISKMKRGLEGLKTGEAQKLLPQCSNDDIWLQSNAISPNGYKRRMKNRDDFNTRYGAKEGWTFEETALRCERYCSIKDWCSQYQSRGS